jgi:hypothetical protein
MKNFLLGVVVGASAALWYSQTRGRLEIDRQFGQMQDRANAVLNESRRILEETRRELSAALEAGRQSFQRVERPRNPWSGETSSSESGETTPPTG